MARTLLACCLLFFAALRCSAQNLVPNPSFELLDTCPYTVGFQEGDRPQGWFSWYNSPEYFHSCAGALQNIDTLVDVPQNGWTFQYAWEGNAYVGIYAYDGGLDEYREYVGAELVEPLVIGCAYQVRFRTNPAFNGSYWLLGGGGVCNNIGLLFTTTSNAWSGLSGPAFGLRNYAHSYSSAVITDTVAWTLVEGTFLADSAYAYVVLGNFFSDALTTGYANAGSWTDITYYLIDSVSVSPVNATCHGVGLSEAEATDKPRVRWSDHDIELVWDRSRSLASITDIAGRPVGPEAMSSGGRLVMPCPRVAGAYLLKVKAQEQMFVFKFVVM
ncbi:MAG: hypothetical protein IPP83_01025 [Flavobacteriales bacterium]|nr:hypothetical protein [Flavobacteriales bacterium]